MEKTVAYQGKDYPLGWSELQRKLVIRLTLAQIQELFEGEECWTDDERPVYFEGRVEWNGRFVPFWSTTPPDLLDQMTKWWTKMHTKRAPSA